MLRLQQLSGNNFSVSGKGKACGTAMKYGLTAQAAPGHSGDRSVLSFQSNEDELQCIDSVLTPLQSYRVCIKLGRKIKRQPALVI